MGERGADAIAQIDFEIGFCAQFLPKAASDDEVRAIVRETVARLGVSDAKQAGRVVGEIMKAHKGKLEPADRQAHGRRGAGARRRSPDSGARRSEAAPASAAAAVSRSGSPIGQPAIDRRQPGRHVRDRRVAVARLAGQLQRVPAIVGRSIPDRLRQAEGRLLRARRRPRCASNESPRRVRAAPARRRPALRPARPRPGPVIGSARNGWSRPSTRSNVSSTASSRCAPRRPVERDQRLPPDQARGADLVGFGGEQRARDVERAVRELERALRSSSISTARARLIIDAARSGCAVPSACCRSATAAEKSPSARRHIPCAAASAFLGC